jgi:hypothetical protein
LSLSNPANAEKHTGAVGGTVQRNHRVIFGIKSTIACSLSTTLNLKVIEASENWKPCEVANQVLDGCPLGESM